MAVFSVSLKDRQPGLYQTTPEAAYHCPSWVRGLVSHVLLPSVIRQFRCYVWCHALPQSSSILDNPQSKGRSYRNRGKILVKEPGEGQFSTQPDSKHAEVSSQKCGYQTWTKRRFCCPSMGWSCPSSWSLYAPHPNFLLCPERDISRRKSQSLS